MKAYLVALVAVLLVPVVAANRDSWIATGQGESVGCTSAYVVQMSRAQPGTFRWNIDVTSVPSHFEAGCGIWTHGYKDIVASDGGPWTYERKTPAPCATDVMLRIGHVPLDQGGPIPIEYRMLKPCEGVFDFGEGTVIAVTPNSVDCISLLCTVTS